MHYLVGSAYFSSTLALIPPLLFAQEAYPQPEIGAAQIFIYLIAYLIAAFLCWKIFEKLNIENAWFAWIPILGTYITFVAGDEENPTLWTILSLIPCINIVAVVKLIIAWVRICKKLGKSPWLLLICLVPCGAFFVFGYLAFG